MGGGGWGVINTNRLLLGGGVRLRNKNLAGGGGRRRNDGFTKKLPSPHQLINNDRPLNCVCFHCNKQYKNAKPGLH